jgi:hypothetical protein
MTQTWQLHLPNGPPFVVHRMLVPPTERNGLNLHLKYATLQDLHYESGCPRTEDLSSGGRGKRGNTAERF